MFVETFFSSLDRTLRQAEKELGLGFPGYYTKNNYFDWSPWSDDGEQYTLSVRLAGYKRDEISVELGDDGALTVKAVVAVEDTTPSHRRKLGEYVQAVTVPDDADEATLVAKHEDGVLMLTLNKREREVKRTRQIEIS